MSATHGNVKHHGAPILGAYTRLDGSKLRLLRKRAGYTVAMLAAKCDVSAPHLSGLERGRRNASPPVQRRIAEALGVEPAELEAESDPEGAGEEAS